jgi:signal transduction histidine kinase
VKRWTIRTRTALAFAVTAMALAAGVVVFTNLMSQIQTLRQIEEQACAGRTCGSTAFEPTSPGATGGVPTTGAEIQFVAVVAEQQWIWAAVGTAIAGLLAGLLGWLLTRRVLRPIDRIAATASRISGANLRERIALDGPDDEVRQLATTMDALFERLEGAFERQRRFVAQASHELRTPLAVQRASLQIGLGDDASPEEIRNVRTELLEQNRRTETLVESLLALADAERDLAGRLEPVDVGGVVAAVVAAHEGAAIARGVVLQCEVRHAPVVRAEPALVTQLVRNLVDNAIEYNVRGGWVRVAADHAGFSVENTGELVRSDDVAALVQPFRRGDAGASTSVHSGLGLSIVDAIVRAHGWTLSLEPRSDGGLRTVVSWM